MPNTVQINTISPYHFVVYFGGIGLGAKNLCKNPPLLLLLLPLLLFVLSAVSPFHRFDIQYDGCDDDINPWYDVRAYDVRTTDAGPA